MHYIDDKIYIDDYTANNSTLSHENIRFTAPQKNSSNIFLHNLYNLRVLESESQTSWYKILNES